MTTIHLTINGPCDLTLGSKDGTANIGFMGGSFYISSSAVALTAGNYVGATFECTLFRGEPQPRRLINLDKGGK
jgi:hypothetical protein